MDFYIHSNKEIAIITKSDFDNINLIARLNH